MAAGEQYKLSTRVDQLGAGLRRRLPVEGRLRHVARSGAEAAVQPQPLPLQLALALGYGNGDTGNQGPHQFDIARWGLRQAGASDQGQLDRRVLRARVVTGNSGHPDGALRVCRRHDPRVRHARRAHERRRRHPDWRSVLRLEGLAVDRRDRQQLAVLHGRRRREERKGPGSEAACRARAGRPDDERRATTCRTSSTPSVPTIRSCSRATCSKGTCRRRCRTWRTSRIASATGCASIRKSETFEDDKKADALLNRDGGYRKGFEIPKSFT